MAAQVSPSTNQISPVPKAELSNKVTIHFSSHAGSQRCPQNMLKAVVNYCQQVGHPDRLSRFKSLLQNKQLITSLYSHQVNERMKEISKKNVK